MTAGDAAEGRGTGEPLDPRRPELSAVGPRLQLPAHWDFPESLRAAISASGRSLESLRRRLSERGAKVSIATLSYWQSGRSRPARDASLEAVRHLEEILELPAGELTSRLGDVGPARGQRRLAPVALFPDDTPLPDQATVLASALEELGFGAHQELLDISVHATLELGADGSTTSQTLRNVVRAARDGAHRMPSFICFEGPVTEPPRFVPGHGVRIGRQIHNNAMGVHVVEVMVDRPLRRDEIAVVEHTAFLPRGVVAESYTEYYLVRRCVECVQWVQFHPDRVPTRVETYQDLDGDTLTTPLRLSGTSAHHVVHDIGPGKVGIRWTW